MADLQKASCSTTLAGIHVTLPRIVSPMYSGGLANVHVQTGEVLMVQILTVNTDVVVYRLTSSSSSRLWVSTRAGGSCGCSAGSSPATRSPSSTTIKTCGCCISRTSTGKWSSESFSKQHICHFYKSLTRMDLFLKQKTFIYKCVKLYYRLWHAKAILLSNVFILHDD